MRDYLTFESEFDRLKGLFLLEGADDDLAEGTNADSENDEGSKEDKSGDSGDDLGLDGGNGGDTDGGEEGGDDGEPASDDIDLDGDSDLGDLTGNPGDAPDAGEVNAENAPPGAINPKTLLQEMSTGEDNIYTRVVKAVKEKFPGGKCQVKDLMVPIVHAVKAYMKNKNYAPISKEAMKAICINVARTIHDQGMKNAQKRSTVESAVYFKKAPYLESQELMEGWKERLLAGTLGVCHKHNAINTAKHQLTGAVVINLTGNGIKLETGLETLDIAKIQRKEVKEQGTVAFGSQGHHVRALVLGHFLVNHLEVRGLATQTRSVVHHLTTNLSCSKIY